MGVAPKLNKYKNDSDNSVIVPSKKKLKAIWFEELSMNMESNKQLIGLQIEASK